MTNITMLLDIEYIYRFHDRPYLRLKNQTLYVHDNN